MIEFETKVVRWAIEPRGAARGRTERVSLLLKHWDADGGLGFGEAAPLPGMSPESIDDVIDALTSGREPPRSMPSAWFAIETAMLSAEAHRKGVSLSQLLLHEPPPAMLPTAPVVDDLDEARIAWSLGARTFKLKIGPHELQRVAEMAAALPDARFRIDANRSWPAGDARAMIAELARFPIDYVEEPCVHSHHLLDAELALPIALDEGLRDVPADEMRAVLSSPQLATVVIKPTLLGLTTAFQIASRARSAVISHALEGSIGMAACCELALACKQPGPMGLAPHPGTELWEPRVRQLSFYTIRPAGPGLGFDADCDTLRLVGLRADVDGDIDE